MGELERMEMYWHSKQCALDCSPKFNNGYAMVLYRGEDKKITINVVKI
jgi:hypothetical protein